MILFKQKKFEFYQIVDTITRARCTEHSWPARAGGKSGLLGTAYRLMTGRGNLTIRATVTNRLNSGETGNLYAQQLQIGPL